MNNFRGEYNVGAKNFHFMALPIEVAGGQRSKVLVASFMCQHHMETSQQMKNINLR